MSNQTSKLRIILGRFCLVQIGMMIVDIALMIRLLDTSDGSWLHAAVCTHTSLATFRCVLFWAFVGCFVIGILSILAMRGIFGLSTMAQPKVLSGLRDESFSTIGIYVSLVSMLMVGVDSWCGIVLLVYLWVVFTGLFMCCPQQLLNPTFLVLRYRLLSCEHDIEWEDKKFRIPRGSYILARSGYQSSGRVGVWHMAENLYFIWKE